MNATMLHPWPTILAGWVSKMNRFFTQKDIDMNVGMLHVGLIQLLIPANRFFQHVGRSQVRNQGQLQLAFWGNSCPSPQN